MAVVSGWIALVHATLWWLEGNPVPRALWGDEKTYLASAMQLLSGDPSWWPEPLWPPLYPQFLAGVVRLGGGSMVAVAVVQGALLAIAALLLFDLSKRWTGSRAAGIACAAVALGYPPLVAFTHYLWPEILHLFLFVALLWILALRADRPAWCVVAGVVLGLALLSKSLLLPFLPVVVVAAVWGRPPRQAIGAAMLVLGAAAVTVAPTAMANLRRTGAPAIANSATFNLWVGLNDVGRESFRHDVVWPEYQRWVASAEHHAARDRILRSKIRELLRERGVPAVIRSQMDKQYFRLFEAGCYLTDQLPGGAAQEVAGAGYLGVEPGLGRMVGAATVASIVMLYVASITGMTLGGCRGNRWVRALVLFIGYNLLLFFWLHVKTRYRVQMLPAAFLGTACLVAWFESGWRPRPSAARWATAFALTALLMWFAFG